MKNSPLSDEVLITLRQIMRAISQRSKKLMQKYGLTSPQIVVIKEIQRFDEVGVGVLSRNINLSQATVTSILDRLEFKGIIERTRSKEDKRKVFVRLSKKGEELLSHTPPLLHEEFVLEFEKLELWEQTLLLSSLQRIASMMNAKPVEEIPFLDTGEIENP